MNTALDNKVCTVRAALEQAERILFTAGATSQRWAAEWLMSDVLACSRLEIYTRLDEELDEARHALWESYLARAQRHEPVQYILGETNFMGLRIACDRRALIPRPETEFMTGMIVDDMRQHGRSAPVGVDVGTGTGCIALALADALPQARLTAIEMDGQALALARENAARLGLTARIAFREGDLLEGVEPESADLVVANLPYISTDMWGSLPPAVRDYEPRCALDGGARGLDYIERLTAQAQTVLRRGGRLYLEIGADQGDAVRAIAVNAGFVETTVIEDWARRDRVVRGGKP